MYIDMKQIMFVLAYNQMKFICKAMGMELDYKTYQNMKQSLEETIIEQGSDPNNLAKIAGWIQQEK